MMEIGIISDRSVIFMAIGDLVPKINILCLPNMLAEGMQKALKTRHPNFLEWKRL